MFHAASRISSISSFRLLHVVVNMVFVSSCALTWSFEFMQLSLLLVRHSLRSSASSFFEFVFWVFVGMYFDYVVINAVLLSSHCY